MKNNSEVECKLFDKWKDKLIDFNILHCFALKEEIYDQVKYAKSVGVKVVISSIVPLSKPIWVKLNILLGKYFHIRTIYFLNKQTLDMADLIIAETQKEKIYISCTYGIPIDKIVAIPNGISTDVQGGDPSLIKKKFGFEKECVVHVSRIDRNKNQLNVIRAMKDTDIPIVFIGGPDTNDMAYYEQCRKEATDNMYFAGWIYHDDPLLSSALSAAKVSILPSFKETFGYSIYEGLLTGCNVVATNVIPLDEWGLNNNVVSIDPANIDDIRRGIFEAYYKEVDQDVPQKILSTFSFDVIAQRHIALYKKILS